MVQLTTQEIEQVDAFVQGYVRYDDVRVEVVQQLSEEIGLRRARRPAETFGKALWELGHNKGKKLHTFISQKKKELRKFWAYRLLQVIINFVCSPQILWVVAVFFLLLYICHLISPIVLLLLIFICVSLMDLFGFVMGNKELPATEVSRYLASEAYNKVHSVFLMIFYAVILFWWMWVQDYDTTQARYFVAILGAVSVFLRFVGKAYRQRLEEYYDQFPILKAKREELV